MTTVLVDFALWFLGGIVAAKIAGTSTRTQGARTMAKLTIGLLNKRRGNFIIQEKFVGSHNVVDNTVDEVEHHETALTEAGYAVRRIDWGPGFIKALQTSEVDLVFNVSSLAEAAILEELEIPYVGSNTPQIAITLNKSLAKRLWQQEGLPTSPFWVAGSTKDCEIFRQDPPFNYPLFIKPVAGRGSAGVNCSSVVLNYDQLISGVMERIQTIRQPVLIEKYLRGREITIGIVGNEDERVLPPLEIVYREGDVALTFEKKELDNDSFLCPAPLDREQTQTMESLALRAYRVLGLKDFGRIDTILTDEGPFLLEANAFAGLMCTPREKPHSYIGFMARAEGMDGKDLLDGIIQSTLKRLSLKGIA